MTSDEQSYREYFEGLCESHVSLGEGKSFYGDDDNANNKAKSWSGNMMWIEHPEPTGVIDNNSDNYLGEQKGVVLIGGAAASKTFEAEETQYQAVLSIMKDVISKMLYDYNDFTLLIKKGSIRFGRAEETRSSTKFIFCRMEFIWHDPSGFPYNEANWN